MRTFFLIIMVTTLVYGSYIRDAASMTVYDDQSDLTWEDGKNHLRTWEGAIGYCEALSIGGARNWRLPNVNELLSIVDYNTQNTVINPAFNYLVNQPYWSSTTDARDSGSAWYVNFSDGYSRSFPKSVSRYVRCVRKGKLSSSGGSDASSLPAIYYLLR